MTVEMWILLLVAGVAVAIICQVRPEKFKATPNQRDVLLFSATTLAVAVAGYFVFLKNLGFITNAWYYAALMAVVAATIETMLSAAAQFGRGPQGQTIFVGWRLRPRLC